MTKIIINSTLASFIAVFICYFIENTYFASTTKGQILVVLLLLIELVLASTTIANVILKYKK
ncbi:hypothetical protein DY119_01785 [Apilactobacillus micheneri]|nr:hypothetical protein DY119_01785 [Apilactobacillus micheneri]